MPGVWSRPISWLFDKFDVVVVYLDDIGIFSKTNEEHTTHLCEVFTCLRPEKAIFLCQEKLYAHQNKCFFEKKSIDFLGHTVSKDGLSVDKRKTSAMDTMAPPTTRKELFRFLDLAGHYTRFYAILPIKHFP